MKLDKKISVIIPTYNSSAYIRRALESVKKQTYSNWEIIVIDGGSSDNTLNLLKQFDKSKIKIFYLPKENGLAASRYYGICKSSGSYVAFLDSDDFWDKNKLLYQIRSIGLNNKFVCTNFTLKNKKKIMHVNIEKDILRLNDIIYNRPIALSSVMAEKRIIKNIIKNKIKNIYAEDYLWWISILKAGHYFSVVKKNLTFISYHNHNRSIKFLANYLSLIKIYRNELGFNYLKIIVLFFLLFIKTFKKNIFKFKAFAK